MLEMHILLSITKDSEAYSYLVTSSLSIARIDQVLQTELQQTLSSFCLGHLAFAVSWSFLKILGLLNEFTFKDRTTL